jgi:hypothetical protein
VGLSLSLSLFFLFLVLNVPVPSVRWAHSFIFTHGLWFLYEALCQAQWDMARMPVHLKTEWSNEWPEF